MKSYNPLESPVPATYSHAIETPANARTVYVAGQVGRHPNGTIPEGIEAQTKVVFENLVRALESAGMALEDVVKTTVFLTDRNDQPTFIKTRSRILGLNRPASTLVYVDGLVSSELCVEIEAIAAKLGAPRLGFSCVR